MQPINNQQLEHFIQEQIAQFHHRRIQSLSSIKLEKLLKRKNPYLFRAKDLQTPEQCVRAILDAHLSSQEETLFGTLLESLAIFVAQITCNGRKSAAEGIDLEFEHDDVLYLVAIKSGPNWGNSSQIKRMIDNFKQARRILGTNTTKKRVICVNGCCYGREQSPDKGDYLKLCGQQFWSLISGSATFYRDIIEPLGHNSPQRNAEFAAQYAMVVARFVHTFTTNFCDQTGAIDWSKLIALSSAAGD